MRESTVQTSIKEALEKSGWLVVKCIQMSKNGWPDLQAHKQGVTVFIECKSPGKTARDLQLLRHKHLRQQGFEVISEATSKADVKHLL